MYVFLWIPAHTHTHTPCQNAQAALNHNTFYWSRLNSHKASLKKEIGPIRNRFSWKRVLRENTGRAWKCAMLTCSGHLYAHSCMGRCSYCVHIIFINLSAVYCATLAASITVFFTCLTLSLCHFATAANILLARAAGCWYWSIWCWDRSSSKLRPPIHLRAIKCD